MKDATGRDIVIGRRYGYSQQSSGRVHVVTGIVEKTKDGKATLGSVQERSGLWGSIDRDFHEETRRRSVNICHLFPVEEYIMGDIVTTEYYNHGERFEVVGIRKDELELRGDWSGGTHNVDQTSWYSKDKCKLYRNDKKQKSVV